MINIDKKFLIKRLNIDFILLFFIINILIYSIFIIWSASNKNINMLENKIIQIIIGLIFMLIFSYINPKVYEKLSPYFYIFSIVLLIIVDVFGQSSKGAQRWLNIGLIKFQPSEITKISVPLMLSRLINYSVFPPSLKIINISLLFIFIPVMLIATQPDLGTAVLVAISGLLVLFLSGIRWKFIYLSIFFTFVLLPIIWFFFMHEYQKHRILVLFNPNMDPLGSGYHIIQSKIAIGSGGLCGKKWLHGSQSQLKFLPECHTDFIFAVLGEELGLIGVIFLILLYLGLIIRGLYISCNIQNTFNRIIVANIMIMLFVYVFVNIGMVTGLLPIVGISLPLISYGGSSLVVLMSEFGIVMSMKNCKKNNIYNSL